MRGTANVFDAARGLLPPPLKRGSSGLAYPDMDRTIACVRAPAAVDFAVTTGHQFEIKLNPGDWHVVQENLLVHYRNNELDDRRIYEIMGNLPADDPRAQFLRQFWAERGHRIRHVQAARKIAPTPVVGVVADEAVGRRIRTHEAIFTLRSGMLLMRSAQNRTVYWLILNLDQYSHSIGEDGKRINTRRK